MSADQLQLDTPRLLLRPPRIEDFGPWAALLEDAEASHFIGGPQPPPLALRGLMVVAGAAPAQGEPTQPREHLQRWSGLSSRSVGRTSSTRFLRTIMRRRL